MKTTMGVTKNEVIRMKIDCFKAYDIRILSENQSTFIPLGSVHRLRNPGKIPLELIEIQSGSYLGEDDIERFEDHYGRDRE
jgi:mannose-1-phosphate guanylyltransferase/mannose-6-phosphate isomerase